MKRRSRKTEYLSPSKDYLIHIFFSFTLLTETRVTVEYSHRLETTPKIFRAITRTYTHFLLSGISESTSKNEKNKLHSVTRYNFISFFSFIPNSSSFHLLCVAHILRTPRKNLKHYLHRPVFCKGIKNWKFVLCALSHDRSELCKCGSFIFHEQANVHYKRDGNRLLAINNINYTLIL